MPGAAVVEAAAGGLQPLHRPAQFRKRHAVQPAGGHGGHRIAEVVQPGQRQRETPHGDAVFVEGGHGAVAVQLLRDGGKGHAFGVADRPPMAGLELLPQDRTVAVGQQLLAAAAEALHGGDQGRQVGVVVGVVQLQVGDHPQPGLELHQGAVGFIRFRHQQRALAIAAIAAEGGHHAADHGGGVVVGGVQQAGDQRAGGGFAVAAGHGHAALLGDQGRQHIGAVQHLQSGAARLLQFGVVGRHRRAHHHQRRGGGAAADGVDGGGALLAEDAHPAAAQVLQHGVVAGVGAAHRIAAVRQDPGDGRHADPTDADEVHGLVAIQLLTQGRVQACGDAKPRTPACLAGPVVPIWGQPAISV